ncbi:MAG TPA: glycosyltransferase [Coriobacteriia bacterium]
MGTSVSVMMPTFRRARSGLLAEALDSVLAQTYRELQLIVIDDGSTDGTAEILREYADRDERIVVIRHDRNSGLPGLRIDQALHLAEGEYISYMFDDDEWYPSALETLRDHLEAHPETDLVYGDVRFPFPDSEGIVRERVLGAEPAHFDPERLAISNYIANVAVMHRRTCLAVAGVFDPNILIRRLCDWDLWLRMAKRCRIEHVPVLIGEAKGLLTSDSLGLTAALPYDLTRRYMMTERDEYLSPELAPSRRIDDLSLFEGKLTPDELAQAYAAFAQFYRQIGDEPRARMYESELARVSQQRP